MTSNPAPARILRLGVDARALSGQLAGIGNYIWEILQRIGPAQVSLYCAPEPPIVPIPPEWSVRVARLPRQVALKHRFGYWALEDGIDVFWAPQTLLPKLPGRIATVATVHDLNHLLVPETMSWGTRLAHQLWFAQDVRRADVVVANSHGTAARVAATYGCDARVAQPGVAFEFARASPAAMSSVRERYGLPEDYLLAVSTLEPRKNIARLVDAHGALFSRGDAPPLVLVGKHGWRIAESDLSRPGVHAIGYVPRADLPALFSAATAFLMPSLYEGFGMPVAEARACGCAIMATDIPELREACEDEGVFVSPDVPGITAGIRAVLAAPRPAPRRAFAWESAAAVYRQAFTDALAMR